MAEDLTWWGQASPCRKSFSKHDTMGPFSKETPKPAEWLVNGRRGCGWTLQMPHNHAFPHINIQEQLPAPPALCDGNMQLLLCLQILAAFWCLCNSWVLRGPWCSTMWAQPWRLGLLLFSAACSAELPALPAHLSQGCTGVYGHSSNQKELRKVASPWHSFMVKLIKCILHTTKATFFYLDLLFEDY